MITEFVPRGSLEQILKNQTNNSILNDTNKLIIIYGIASAMSYLHFKNIIHRDLTLSNVLIDNSFYPKLVGFGLSIALNTDVQIENEIIGKNSYIAPKFWRNKENSKKSDVFAFGIFLYELMNEKIAFSGFNSPQICYKIAISKSRPSISQIVGLEYKKLIEACWSDDVNAHPTFESICNQLKTNQNFCTEKVDLVAFNK